MKAEKKVIIEALRAHINSRSGIDYVNYGDRAAFQTDYRRILKDGRDARELLRAIEWRDSIKAEDILAAFNQAYNGRLSCVEDGAGGVRLKYCAGQYYAVEYRAAACAVLARVLRTHAAPDHPDGERLRAYFRREFGRGIASRWFN